MDTTQLLLMVVLSITTILLILVGVQLIFFLRDVRKTLKKINQIIEGLENLGVNLNHGLTEVSGFVTGLRTIITTIELLKQRKNDKQSQ